MEPFSPSMLQHREPAPHSLVEPADEQVAEARVMHTP
jgi:hypothetical protein